MRTYLLGVLFGITAIVALNYFVDSEEQWFRFRTPFERALKPGESRLIRSAAPSERGEKLSQYLISPKADVVLVGSSRAMGTRQQEFNPEYRFFNLALSGGNIEEYAAFWRASAERGHLPRYWIVSLEATSFNANFKKGPELWLKRTGYLQKIYPEKVFSKRQLWTDQARIIKDQFLMLIKWETLKLSLKFLGQHGLHFPPKFEVLSEDQVPESMASFRHDGSLAYPKKVLANLDFDKIRQAAALTPNPAEDYLYLNYVRSADHIWLLHWLAQEARLNKIRLMVLVPPVHPASYAHIQETPEYRDVTLDYPKILDDLKQQFPEVAICDFLNPALVPCSETDFMDANHMLATCDQKLLDRCLPMYSEWAPLAQKAIPNSAKK